MLARSGPQPATAGWAFEVKWDGFRCLVDGLRAVSRRRWNMTALLPELAGLPSGLTLDGELVVFRDGSPTSRCSATGCSTAEPVSQPPISSSTCSRSKGLDEDEEPGPLARRA
jgi:hypothetical protein